MNQFGTLLIDMWPDLVAAHSELEIAERGWQHRGIVWMPSNMVMREEESIPHSWDVTSDSLALWLAKKLSAEHLVLVKSTPPLRTASLQQMVDQGVIDTAFAQFAQGSQVKSWAMYKGDYAAFSNGFHASALEQAAHQLT